MEPTVRIRPARLDELEVAGNLRARMAEEEGLHWDDESPGWRTRYVEFFRRKQRAGDAQLFFAQRGESIVGMAAFSVLDEYRAAAFGQPRGWVNSVFVVAELRRRGIARELMGAGIEWLRRRGCVIARLRTSNDGERLYEELGFVRGREMELRL
ncbi:MAG: GNAT family N-acetyltransferase [Candidatus Eremiobacteraeota bacterium]|nr:GNAT family N-acetyltransferase [Candidatus Eremiobacteraeota bacterium]